MKRASLGNMSRRDFVPAVYIAFSRLLATVPGAKGLPLSPLRVSLKKSRAYRVAHSCMLIAENSYYLMAKA